MGNELKQFLIVICLLQQHIEVLAVEKIVYFPFMPFLLVTLVSNVSRAVHLRFVIQMTSSLGDSGMQRKRLYEFAEFFS